MAGIANVLIVVYLLIVLAMIAVILLQRSEGGALGIGGGNSFMSARGSANLLTRTTAILATLFFVTAIGLTILTEIERGGSSGILDRAAAGQDGPAPTNVLDALDAMSPAADQGLPVPAAETPAAPAAAPAGDAPNLAVPTAPATETPAPAQAPAATEPAPAAQQPAAPAASGTETTAPGGAMAPAPAAPASN